MRSAFYAVVVLLIGLLALLWAKNGVLPRFHDATELVIAAVDSTDKINYVAEARTTAMFRGKKITSTIKLFHTPTAERIEYKTGLPAGAVVISRDGHVYSYRPGSDISVAESASCVLKKERVKLLLKNHVAVISGQRKIAGRKAYVVTIAPKGSDSSSRRLWIDKATHVVLRTDDIDANGRLRTSSEFTRVDFNARIPSSTFVLPADAKTAPPPISSRIDRDALSHKLGFQVTLPKYMVKGYELCGYRLFRCECNCGHISAQVTYTNGLSTISVFEAVNLSHCGANACDTAAGGMTRDSCRMMQGERGSVAVVQRDAKAVVVVADLRESEVRKIAQSVP